MRGMSTAEPQEVGEEDSPCSTTGRPSAAVLASRTARWMSVNSPEALTPRVARTDAGGRITGRRPVLVRDGPGSPMEGKGGAVARLSRNDRRLTGVIRAVSGPPALDAEGALCCEGALRCERAS